MAETCVFCQRLRPRSDPPEHVFPQWVSRTLLKLPGGAGLFQIRSDNPAVPSFSCAIVEITTNSVCAKCNHGWMSDLESVASPLLKPAILGNPVELSPRLHAAIAAWAVKTAMMMDCYWGDRGEPRFVPDAHCREFCSTRRPRSSTYVWITTVGYDPRTQSFQEGVLARTQLELEGLSSGDHFDGYAKTWHFGYLGVQVVCLGVDDESFNSGRRAPLKLPDGQVVPADAFTRQLHPATNVVIKWPPPNGLEQIGFGVFARQPPFVIGERSPI